MRTVLKNQRLIIVGLVLLFPFSTLAAENNRDDLKQQIVTQRQSTKVVAGKPEKEVKRKEALLVKGVSRKEALRDKVPSELQNMPVYRPPLRGVPAGRVAGGTRGVDTLLPLLCTLAPDHVGLTVSEQPLLCFFLAQSTDFPLEFTIIEHRGVFPLLETRLQPPLGAGIHTIRLADYGKHLREGIQYRWFVALVLDENHRAKDILASATIECVPQRDEFKEKLRKTDAAQAASIFAENGIWYDALATLSNAIEDGPNSSLIRKRAFLLEQVGLTEAARYESQKSVRK